MARQLALTRGERVVRIRRVRLADGVPLSFDETYLPLEIGKKIITNNLKVEPIFSLLERKYDVPLVEAEYKLDAVAAENEVARPLKVKPRSPIFRIERTSYSTGSRPVDYETLTTGEISSDSSHALSERLPVENLPISCAAYDKPLLPLPKIIVDRHRPRTTQYKRRKARNV